MNEISIQDSELVGGAGFWGWVGSQIAGGALQIIARETLVMQGNIDYSGIADSQGTYYNTVGA